MYLSGFALWNLSSVCIKAVFAFSWTLSPLNMPFVMHESSFLPLICLLLASHSVEFAFSIHQSSFLPLIHLQLTIFSVAFTSLNGSKLLLAPFRSLFGFFLKNLPFICIKALSCPYMALFCLLCSVFCIILASLSLKVVYNALVGSFLTFLFITLNSFSLIRF